MAAPVILGLSVYLWILLISLLLLVLFASVGHYGFDFDGGGVEGGADFGQFTGPGISPLSPPLLAAFGASFGALGAILDSQGYTTLWSAVGGVIGASVIAFGLFYVTQRFLIRAQTSSDVQPQTLIGASAQVLIPIRPGSQGQILVITPERGRTLFPAVAGEEIPRDAVVEIHGFAGGVANVRRKAA